MLQFSRLTLQDLPQLADWFSENNDRLCDGTVGGEFLWRDYYSIHWAMQGKSLCLMARYPEDGGFNAYSYPIGGDEEDALDAMAEYAGRKEIPLIFCPASEEDTRRITARWPQAVIEPQRRWYDYLYAAEDLRQLAGRKFGGQRNHINRFKKENPDWRFEVITADNLFAVRSFFEKLIAEGGKEFAAAEEETAKIFEVMDHWQLYGFAGGALFVGEEVVAFSMAETVGDTLYVHIEKASRAVHGAYPMIVQQTALAFAGEGIRWINREDDAGDEGLRTVKLSYHPAALLPKYKVIVAPHLCCGE